MKGTREEYYDVFNVFTPIMVGVAIAVWLLTLFMVVRYRRPEGGMATGRKTENPIPESLYVVGLTLLAAFLVYLTFTTMDEETDPGPSRPPAIAQTPERVNITAFRWAWRFDYPRYGITQVTDANGPAKLVVPVDTPIDFEERTTDVIHSFFVSEVRFKADAFPGQVNRFRLIFPTPAASWGSARSTAASSTLTCASRPRCSRWTPTVDGSRGAGHSRGRPEHVAGGP